MLLLLAAPRGLEPRNPESESGVLPIRLKGNMQGIKQTTFTALSALVSPIPMGFHHYILLNSSWLGRMGSNHRIQGSKPCALATSQRPNIVNATK